MWAEILQVRQGPYKVEVPQAVFHLMLKDSVSSNPYTHSPGGNLGISTLSRMFLVSSALATLWWGNDQILITERGTNSRAGVWHFHALLQAEAEELAQYPKGKTSFPSLRSP